MKVRIWYFRKRGSEPWKHESKVYADSVVAVRLNTA